MKRGNNEVFVQPTENINKFQKSYIKKRASG